MEQSRKNLKFMSIAMIILALLSLGRVALELIFTDFNVESVPGATAGTEFIAVIVLAVVGFILMLPQLFIGLKGMRVANNPDSSKGHITWATILLVISIIALVAYGIQAIKTGEYKENVSAILNMLLDVVLYSTFIKYAKEVKENA